MSTMPQKTRYTPEEYLSLERSAEHKHEFYAGEIFAMAGASKEHVRISRISCVISAINSKVSLASRLIPTCV